MTGVSDQLYVAMGKVLTDYHWRAFCDSWLAIGLAASLVRWGSDGIIGWSDEAECRRYLSQAVGRVRKRSK